MLPRMYLSHTSAAVLVLKKTTSSALRPSSLGLVYGRDCIKPGSNKIANRLFVIPHKKFSCRCQ
jgi:hypothetical protein